MRFAFLGRDVLFYLVREKYHTYFVVVLNRRESQSCGHFRHHIAFHLRLRTEVATAAYIYQQHHRQFTLLLEYLDVRLVQTRRYIPVYRAYIVPGLLLTHLRERHTTPLELRMVLTRKDVPTKAVGLNLYPPYSL